MGVLSTRRGSTLSWKERTAAKIAKAVVISGFPQINARGDKRPLELFLAGIRGWEPRALEMAGRRKIHLLKSMPSGVARATVMFAEETESP